MTATSLRIPQNTPESMFYSAAEGKQWMWRSALQGTHRNQFRRCENYCATLVQTSLEVP
jgi:hypothetical protein